MRSPRYNLLNAAYLFYYGTELAFEDGAEVSSRLKRRLEELITDALVIADHAKFDVMNALTLMDNVSLLQDLRVCVVFWRLFLRGQVDPDSRRYLSCSSDRATAS